jgi:hypothetical protein
VLVVLRMAELLAILTIAGLPVTLLLLPAAQYGRKRFAVSGRLLLAPATGLAVLALYTSVFYALGEPVEPHIILFWGVVAVFWVVLLVLRRKVEVRFERLRRPSVVSAISHAVVLFGLLIALAPYLWPFIENSNLVFWHYAGSDGYVYMRIAEHIGAVGSGQIPPDGPYDASSGFLAAELRLFQAEGWVDKPGTMTALAGTGSLLRVIPQEAFSPLVLSSLAIFYLTLVVFALVCALPIWIAVAFGIFGTLAPAVWLISTYTFLGNVLALPMFPLVLLLVRQSLSPRTGAYAGLILGAQTVLFPDGTLALVGMCALFVLYLLVDAARSRTLRRLLAGFATGVLTLAVVLAPFRGVLVGTAFWRLGTVLSNAIYSTVTGAPRTSGSPVLHPLATFDWIWGAFNLNALPPAPLKPGEVPYIITLVVFVVVYLARSVRARRLDGLFFYVVGLGLLLLVGLLGGIFLSDYELFRALAVFAFVPMALLFTVPAALLLHSRVSRRHLVSGVVLAFASVATLAHFAENDRRQFSLVYTDHLPDAQYTSADIRDRFAVAELASGRPIVLSSETPSFTALVNAVTLFSSSKVGVATAYHKLFFFGAAPPKELQYTADLVLENRRYSDIFSLPSDYPVLYQSDDFQLVENDLIPFFDNDTFPLVAAVPTAYLTAHGLPVARTLSQETEIPFFSREVGSVDITVQFAPEAVGQTLSYMFNSDQPQGVRVDEGGRAVLVGQSVSGLNRVVLTQPAVPLQARLLQVRRAD